MSILIILFIFFSSCATYSPPYYYEFEGEVYSITDQSNCEISCLIELYEKYEQECYNDSSQITHHNQNGDDFCISFSGSIGYSYCISEGHFDEKIWVHKQPTFEGFIEYLKNNNH